MQESNSLQIFGRLMTSLEGTSLTIEDKKLLSNKHVGGIVLFLKILNHNHKFNHYAQKLKR